MEIRAMAAWMRGVVAALALAAGGAPALGQSAEYELQGDEWIRTAAPEPGTDEAVMAEARRHLAADEPKQAKKVLDPWIEANKRVDNPWLPQAYLLRGDALVAMGREYKALYDYEALIKHYPGAEEFAQAIDREVDIGVRYLEGLRRKVFGMRIEKATGIGEELLIRAQERMPGSRLAERAAIELADYYYREREMKMASEMYGIFLYNYPESTHREDAMLRRIYANIARFKGPEYDSGGLLEAKFLIEDFIELYPAAAAKAGVTEGLLTRIDESAALQMLETSSWYLIKGDEPAARFTLRRLLRRHPESAAAQRALRVMIDKGWVEEPEELVEAGESE